ncbi:MAG: PrpF domain-containing protein [Gammaproteobacteria bacterium]
MSETIKYTVPCAIMRGGTSKGIYFLLNDLPADDDVRNRLILQLVGGDARQIDGLGGGDMLSAKVAVISSAREAGVDVDYRFVQVVPGENRVDTGPTCGNILAGVGAFAIEKGLVTVADGQTTVLVRDINTGARVEQVVQTPGGKVRYDGNCVIAGVPAAAAPVLLYYLDFAGVKTGALTPTGNMMDEPGGISVSCIDAAMPTVFATAADMGVRGDESCDELQSNTALLQRLETVRLSAAKKMGMGDVHGKVTPKFALVTAPRQDGNICARYFTPSTAHAAFAVSGGIALATAVMLSGTTANACARLPMPNDSGDYPIDIEHPSGMMRVSMRFEQRNGKPHPIKAGVLRTTRLIMTGETYLPCYSSIDKA